MPGTYVDPDLRQRHGDLLFRASLAGRPAYLYVLFEHQSAPDRWLALRLWRYLLRFVEHWQEEHPRARSLPLVVPAVLHHGRGRWRHARDVRRYFRVPAKWRAALEACVPRLRFLLFDLGQLADEVLRRAAWSALARLALLFLKHGRHHRHPEVLLLQAAALIREVLNAPDGREAFAAVARYLVLVNRWADPERLARLLVEEVDVRAGNQFQTAGERLIARGWRRGRKQGRQEGRLEGLLEGRREQLLSLLQDRFGQLPVTFVRRVHQADSSTLDTLARRLLRAVRLEDVFAG